MNISIYKQLWFWNQSPNIVCTLTLVLCSWDIFRISCWVGGGGRKVGAQVDFENRDANWCIFVDTIYNEIALEL